MSTHTQGNSFLDAVRLRWNLFLRRVVHWMVRARVLPDPLEDAGIDHDARTCYVLDTYALSSALILDRACEERGLPRPLHAIPDAPPGPARSFTALRKAGGLFSRRSEQWRSRTLERLIAMAGTDPDADFQVVPVMVLVGRAPDKETGLAKILLSEDWRLTGRVRRLLSLMINGRNTFIQFSEPISLRAMVDEGLDPERTQRKLSRILRTHFKRVRAAAIGPDLSHRRTVLGQVLAAPPVREAIAEKAQKENISLEKAERVAERYGREIAANYSYSFIRIASFVFTWFWNRIYDGVELHNFRSFGETAPGYEVIYVPCHRSHIDYMLASYLLYHNGFVPPHVAAGVNLNLPVVGRFLRMGGAFFLRRSFRSQKLYSAVFSEYLSNIQARGVSIEYFIEGTRSRTGRLLPPKGGMLSMSVRGYLRAPVRPVLFQPIYIGYERLVEGDSYTRELYGRKKRSESLWGLFRSLKILREKYGKAHVSFGEPVMLDELLDARAPGWREKDTGHGRRPEWLPGVVDELSRRIMTGINASADVNSVNLASTVLLAADKHALAEEELAAQMDVLRRLIDGFAYSDRVTVTGRSAEEIIAYGVELGFLERRAHELGDIIRLKPELAVQMTWFRNNITHLLALPALVACCFQNQRQFAADQIRRIALAVQPFLTAELFLPWDRGEYLHAVGRAVDSLVAEGLLQRVGPDGVLERREGGSMQATQLRLLARSLFQTLERYYITVAVLAKNGSGTLTRGELEKLCAMTAERISMLHEFEAPEFSDRNLFREFIQQLRKTGILRLDEDGTLAFGGALDRLVAEAKNILSKEIRHGIIHLVPQVPDEGEDDDRRGAPAEDEPEAARAGEAR